MKSSTLIGTLFAASIAIAHGSNYEVKPPTSRSCRARIINHRPNFFEPYPLSKSPCSLGHSFANQVLAEANDFNESLNSLVDEYFKDMKKAEEELSVAALREEYAEKIKDILVAKIILDADEHGIKLSIEWQAYFHNVGELLIPSAIADLNLGVCDDSGRLGVVNSLKDQLKSGYRENIGMIHLSQPEGHVFAVSNFKNITDFHDKHAHDPNKSVKTLEDYSQILKAVVPENPKRSVTCCDNWLDYDGSIDDFVKAYRRKIIRQERRKENWEKANGREPTAKEPTPEPKLKITDYDYSIPSFRKDRDEDNPEFRCFIKNSLSWLLGIFDRVHNIEQIYSATTETRQPRQSFSRC